MRIFVFAAIAGAFLSACQLDNSPDLDDLLPVSETVSLAINLKGSEWKANKASPIGGRLVDGYTYFSYKVFIKDDDGEERPYVGGITTSIDQVNIDYVVNSDYRIEVSSMKIPSEYDIAHLRSIYNFSVESSDDYEDYQVYYPRVGSNVTLYPFNTIVHIGRHDPYFPSDKFIGESTFFINGKEDHVNVDMYRFSAGIGFRVLNLASGTIEITFNLHQYSFSYYLDSQNSEIKEIRPVNSVFSSNQFTNNLLDSPENVRHDYNITVKLHEEDDIGEVKERILLNSEIYLRRNFMTTYELDMDPFYQEPEREGGVLKLDFVDDELIDRGVENF